MATSTTYLSLILPEKTDTDKIREDFNTNMDTIDGRFSAVYLAVQAKNSVTITGGTIAGVTITGGSITGMTDLAIADGGTGSSTATLARTALGVAIGSDVQAYDADLTAIAALAKTDSNFIVGNGTTWVAENAATAKISIGLGNVENTALSTWVGTSSITTLGTITTGTWSATTIALNKGGTGQTTNTAAFDALSPLTTQGDIIYYNGSDNVRLAKGTDGHYLKQGADIPEWAAVSGNGGYTNLTSFVDQTPWSVFYSNTAGDVTELALGTDGQYLKSTGAASTPEFDTPAGAGETNTASNIGGQVEIFKQKTDEDLEFRTLKADSNKIFVSTTPVEVDIGVEAIGRSEDGYAGSHTVVNKDNPADANGVITSIEIWANTTLLNCEVAIFSEGTTHSLTSHDSVVIGTVTAGSKQTFEVSLDVNEGDFLGMTYTSGKVEYDYTGSEGMWSLPADRIPCSSIEFDFTASGVFSLFGGSGVTLNYIRFDINEENIKLDDLGAPDDTTDLDASTSAHGLLPKLPNVATQFLDGTGAWATLAAGDMPSTINATKIADGTVTNAEFQYINTLSSNAQTQLTLASDKIDYADSPMIVTGGEISEGTTGTYTVAALTALLRATNGSATTGVLTYVTLAEQANQSITAANTTYYIILSYNGGSPTITTSASLPNLTQNIPIGRVMKDGSNNVHFVNGGMKLQDGVRKLHKRAVQLRAIELTSGSAVEYSGTNNFTMAAGVVYVGINLINLGSYNSASTQFTPVYGDGSSGWTEGADRNTLDYEHYDDGDGTLGEVGVSKYGVFWIYRHVDDGHVYVLYGLGSYSLAAAETELEPPKPTHLTDFGILIASIIVPQIGGSITTIQMVTDTFFTGTAVSNHANLSNLDKASAGHTGFAASGSNSDITQLSGLTTPLAANYGGTGVANNAAETITIGGAGTYGVTLTLTNTTDVTLPTSGTLVNTAVTSLSSLATVGTITSGTLSTGAVLADVTMTLGSDADGDIYYRSSNKLTRLGKGTEGHILKQGATNPGWGAAAGGGDVSKVGTPADSQIGVWTGDGTIEGDASLTYDGSNLQLTGDIGSTGTPITKGWFTDFEVTNAIAGSVTGNAATVTSFTPVGGSLTLAGADALTITTTGATNVTLPLGSSTLVNTAVATLSSLTSVGTITTGGLGTGATLGSVTVNIASSAENDIYYAGGSNVLTRLAIEAGGTNKFLRAVSSGAPSWETLATGDIPDISATYAVIAQTFYIGETQVAINRGSAGLALTGITLTGVTMDGTIVGGDNNMTGMGSIGFTQELDVGSKTANFSVDFATDQKQKATLTANTITLTLDTTSVAVGNYILKIINGGLATLTWASESGSIYFPSGDDPSLTSSGTDILAFYFDGTNWYGLASLDFS